jgi:hypothetical protein
LGQMIWSFTSTYWAELCVKVADQYNGHNDMIAVSLGTWCARNCTSCWSIIWPLDLLSFTNVAFYCCYLWGSILIQSKSRVEQSFLRMKKGGSVARVLQITLTKSPDSSSTNTSTTLISHGKVTMPG